MLVLERLQLVVEPVIGSVRDLGIVEDVVAVELVIQLGAELVEARLDVLERWSGHRTDASDAALRLFEPCPGSHAGHVSNGHR